MLHKNIQGGLAISRPDKNILYLPLLDFQSCSKQIKQIQVIRAFLLLSWEWMDSKNLKGIMVKSATVPESPVHFNCSTIPAPNFVWVPHKIELHPTQNINLVAVSIAICFCVIRKICILSLFPLPRMLIGLKAIIHIYALLDAFIHEHFQAKSNNVHIVRSCWVYTSHR